MPISFAELRAREFGRLDAGGHVYLDYTGSGLYAASQVRRHAELLSEAVLGNPHSRNPTSSACTRMVDDVRARILEFFEADPAEYEVVFALNASNALKLVGESYPFAAGSRLALTADNHNSVHGLREFAAGHGAEVHYLPLDEELRVPDLPSGLAGADPGSPNLFVFPAQSNFSGVKHPLEWVETAREMGYDVLLDAAAFVPTNRLSLRRCRPDFVCLSFYKMFGYPTGVGVLLARHEALRKLRRPWFGGGTVRFVSAQMGVQLLWSTGRGFEDGTLNFQGILAVPIGLDFLAEVGLERINRHVMELTERAIGALSELRHSDGSPMVRLYGPRTAEGRGGTLAFNLLTPAGEIVDFRVVEQRAGEVNLSLRTGYFCNPGAAEFALEHSDAKVRQCAGTFTPDSFNLWRFGECLEGRPVGAIRTSFGIASNQADLDRLVEVLATFRDAEAELVAASLAERPASPVPDEA